MSLEPHRRVVLGGSPVDLAHHDEAVRLIADRAATTGADPLGVLSVNVDHVNHFGHGGRWQHVLEHPAASRPETEPDDAPTLVLVPGADGAAEWAEVPLAPPARERPIEWLSLIDGSPIASEARRLTGTAWPRLAGSDLIGPVLDRAAIDGVRVGVLGGSVSAQSRLRERLAAERPDLVLAGLWSPTREELADPDANARLVEAIRRAAVDLLIVGLGKPRQELWIDEHGPRTGAHVLLAFGAAVDFLGGSVRRAPRWVADHGVEWLWRLALEPRRLARRYLVEGPVAYGRLRLHSSAEPERLPTLHGTVHPPALDTASADERGRFVGDGEHADVAALVVSYRSAATLERLLESLREQARGGVRLRVVVVDNASDDGSLRIAAAHSDVVAVDAGGNVGYAAALNIARRHAGDADALLVLNPDLVVQPGAVSRMLARMELSEAGIVVPLLRDAIGAPSRSLRREPTRLRALGDAVLGDRVLGRPDFSSETDSDPESYRHAHAVDWATGAALLIDSLVAARLGDWDERFFLYSEETDYFRRARALGAEAWFEPTAEVVHEGAGSGSSSALAALLAVNRVRYIEKHHKALYAGTFRLIVLAAEAARAALPGEQGRGHRRAALALVVGARLAALPRSEAVPRPAASHPRGSVIVPAHDEEAVIGRTLAPLSSAAAAGALEVVVVCNACSDRTAEIARRFAGVRVVEIAEASKTAALNAGDSAAATWPRLYLDADVDVTADAVWNVFDAVTRGGLLAARPTAVYDTRGADRLVRAYYRARSRVPSLHTALWGAGGYAVSGSGHERIGAFPALIADDEFVDRRFSSAERAVIATAPAVVHVPRTTASLIGVLRRTHRGTVQLATTSGSGERRSSRTALAVLRCAQGPLELADAAVYLAFALAGRVPEAASTGWTRDETTRPAGAAPQRRRGAEG